MEPVLPSERCCEPNERASKPGLDMHRALRSLVEELEAIDAYDHWIEVSQDADLKNVLARSRDQGKEHAAMLLEWIRSRDPTFDAALGAHLFKVAEPARAIVGIDGLSEASDAPLFDGGEARFNFALGPFHRR